jgi:hypothetical protein
MENVDRSLRFWLEHLLCMIANPERIFTRPRLRNILCSLFFVAVCFAILGAIGSSRAIAERARASASSEGGSWGQVDISSDVDVTPPASASCPPPCSMPVGLTENFDNVSPPRCLPTGWQRMPKGRHRYGSYQTPECRFPLLIQRPMPHSSMIRLS